VLHSLTAIFPLLGQETAQNILAHSWALGDGLLMISSAPKASPNRLAGTLSIALAERGRPLRHCKFWRRKCKIWCTEANDDELIESHFTSREGTFFNPWLVAHLEA